MTREQMIEKALERFENKYLIIDPDMRRMQFIEFLKVELHLIATKSAEEERKRIGSIMYRFEDVNRESDDLIGGWSWLKNELFNRKEKS